MKPTRKEIIFTNLFAVALGAITMEKARENIKEEFAFFGYSITKSEDDE